MSAFVIEIKIYCNNSDKIAMRMTSSVLMLCL